MARAPNARSWRRGDESLEHPDAAQVFHQRSLIVGDDDGLPLGRRLQRLDAIHQLCVRLRLSFPQLRRLRVRLELEDRVSLPPEPIDARLLARRELLVRNPELGFETGGQI